MFNQKKIGLVMFFTGLAMLCAMYVRGSAGFLHVVSMAVVFLAGVFLYVLAENK